MRQIDIHVALFINHETLTASGCALYRICRVSRCAQGTHQYQYSMYTVSSAHVGQQQTAIHIKLAHVDGRCATASFKFFYSFLNIFSASSSPAKWNARLARVCVCRVCQSNLVSSSLNSSREYRSSFCFTFFARFICFVNKFAKEMSKQIDMLR